VAGDCHKIGPLGRNAARERIVTIDDILFLGRDAMLTTLLASAPMLLAGMVVGLVISVLQSVTQIQEITLTFVPKIVAVMAAFVIFLPWMTGVVLDFVQPLLGGFDQLVR
jgi:flagellar biosynthetic protein FliQ